MRIFRGARGARCLRFLLLALLAAAAPLQGQQVTARVTEQGIATQGVLVSALDSTGTMVARTLSGADGSVVLPLAPGRYRLRAELIGRRPTETGLFDLGPGQALHREIVLETQPIELEGISAEGTQRCEVRPLPGRDVHTVWEEARKALQAEQIGRESAVYSFDIEYSVREVDTRSRRVLADDRRSLTNLAANPFRSLPAAELAENGYFRADRDGDILYAPSPDVLLSNEFLDSHCFRLVRDARNQPGALGLAFEPVAGRTQTDVAGVLWLDDASAYLRRLDYRYVLLPTRLPNGPYGGEATFTRLPSGVWIVQQWIIRSPIVAMQVGASFNGEERLIGLQEEGAEVVRIAERDGSVVVDATRATLAGVIHDGREGTPLAGATVTIEGSNFTATTDARGQFLIAGVPAGEYRVGWTHPRIADTGFVPDTRDVRLVVGETAEVSFLLPVGAELTLTAEQAAHADSIASITRALGSNIVDGRQRAGADAGDPARIHGRILDHGNGRPIAGAQVTLRGTELAATTDNRGFFVIPSVLGGAHTLEARMLGYGTREESLTVTPGQALDVELRLATEAIELEPISVEVRSRWLAAQGVYDRMQSEISGHFIRRAEMERRGEPDVSQLFAGIPGVRLHSLGAGRRHLRFNRQVGLGNDSPFDGCEPQIYLDGQRYNPMNASDIPGVRVDNIDFLASVDIEAVEVYVGNPPLQYHHPCGVVLFWTRRGG